MEGIIGLAVFATVVAVLVSIAIARTKAEARETARHDYLEHLGRLKADPTNPDLRQKTLQRGRVYSNLSRNSQGVTVFDEVALSNDINAACAGASRPAPAKGQASVEERLAKLLDLRDRGLVSEEEYTERRRTILAEI